MIRHHYSGKVVQNSQLHFGVFLDDKLHGVLSFGPSMDKEKIRGLVPGTQWNQFIELNRMAFDEFLPRNSESRAIGVVFRMLRKKAPHLKWVISFADATMCGDGTIYRAAGFLLTGVKANKNCALTPEGKVVHKMTYESNKISTGYAAVTGGANNWKLFCQVKGWKVLQGFQIRYIYFLDPTVRTNLKPPVLPYDTIDKLGAGMYKGAKIPIAERHAPIVQPARTS